MFQKHDGAMNTVMASSRYLSSSESSFIPLHLEALAIRWAFKKVHFYVAGGPKVTVICDHSLLVPIFNVKQVGDISDVQVVTFKEMLAGYDWREGART